MRWLVFMLLTLSSAASAQLESRVYNYTNTPPRIVEQSIRELVPISHRVKMNPQLQQALVIAQPQIHAQIAKNLNRLDRPMPTMHFWVRVGRENYTETVIQGGLFSIPISNNPTEAVEQHARKQLPPEAKGLPVHHSELRVHTHLLTEDPVAVRLRLTPVVHFGRQAPLQSVTYDQYATDLLVKSEVYLSLQKQLGTQPVYAGFLQEQAAANQEAKTLDVLIGLEALK